MGIKEFIKQTAENERDNIRDIRIPAEKKQKKAKTVLEKLNKGFENRIFDYLEKLLNQGGDKGWVAAGLAGIDSERAWEMRERLLKQGEYKSSVAMGLSGDYITFVWRIKRVEKEDYREEREPMPVRLSFNRTPPSRSLPSTSSG